MATFRNIEARRTKTAELLSQKGIVSLGELTLALDVSESTVRRDLEALSEAGVARRTHGGAVCTAYTTAQRLGFADRRTTNLAEKKVIAAAAAELIEDGQTVIIDGGTTCYHVAAALTGRPLSIVTNSVPIASLLFADMAAEVMLIGGYLYPRTGVALGTMAESQLSRLHASVVVMSCAGVTPDGAFNINQMMADVEQRMMQTADRVILVVDHSKFGRRGLAKICAMEEVDVVVTAALLGPDQIFWLESIPGELILTAAPQEDEQT